MNTPTTTTTTQQDRLTWLKELNFISVFFSWFFMLLSRLAEPCMSLAALYIIIEAGIPAVASTLFTNLSEGTLIAAPEIILPGAFVIAAQAKSAGNTKAWMLYSMCWLFVLLTGVTLASLFVIHLTGTALAVLMCARCTAGVGYSILIRVVTHSTEPEMPTPPAAPPVQVVQNDRIDELANQMKQLSLSITQVNQTVFNLTQNNNYIASNPALSTPIDAVSTSPVQVSIEEVDDIDTPVQIGTSDLDRIDSPIDTPCKDGRQIPDHAASQAVYPDVQGFSQDKVKQIIDARLQGLAWSKIPGNYSRDIKPIREAYELLSTLSMAGGPQK